MQSYAQCTPFTDARMQACDQRADPGSAQAAHVVIGCMGQSGCSDETCVQQKCATELSACSAALAQQQPQQPTQPAQPVATQGGGGFELAYQVPTGWSQVNLVQGAITLSYVKQDQWSPADYKLHIFAAQPMSGSITDLYHTVWNEMVAPSFEVTQPTAPYRRRLASGYGLAFDAVQNARLKQNGASVWVAFYVVYTADRYVPIMLTGAGVEAEPALTQFFDSVSIRGHAASRNALFDTAELVGHWSTQSTSLASYVDSGGNYRGDASMATGEEITLGADGTFSAFFQAVKASGPAYRSKVSGQWTIEDDTLVMKASNGDVDRRRIWAKGTAPRGGTNALNLTNYGTAQPRFFYPSDSINAAWYGPK